MGTDLKDKKKVIRWFQLCINDIIELTTFNTHLFTLSLNFNPNDSLPSYFIFIVFTRCVNRDEHPTKKIAAI